MPTWGLFIYLLGLTVLSVLLGLFFYKRLRRAVPESSDMKRATKGMSWSKKRALARTVRRGEAVQNPADAAAAVAIARTLLGTFRYLESSWWRRLVEVFIVLYAIVILVQTLLERRAPSFNAIWHISLAGLLLVYLIFWRPRARERLKRGLEANERLMAFEAEAGAQDMPRSKDQARV